MSLIDVIKDYMRANHPELSGMPEAWVREAAGHVPISKVLQSLKEEESFVHIVAKQKPHPEYSVLYDGTTIELSFSEYKKYDLEPLVKFSKPIPGLHEALSKTLPSSYHESLYASFDGKPLNVVLWSRVELYVLNKDKGMYFFDAEMINSTSHSLGQMWKAHLALDIDEDEGVISKYIAKVWDFKENECAYVKVDRFTGWESF